MHLKLLEEDVAGCFDCDLSKTRTKTVFGRGDPKAPLVLVGEAPGEAEDRAGVPFVGRSGTLLDEMIEEAGVGRHYICNAIKCRPPENRVPTLHETKACSGFLTAQLELVAPSVVVALGRTAARALGVESQMPTVGWRGTQVPAARTFHKIPVIVTFHPAYVLRSPGSRWYVLDDLRRAQKLVTR